MVIFQMRTDGDHRSSKVASTCFVFPAAAKKHLINSDIHFSPVDPPRTKNAFLLLSAGQQLF